MNSKQSCLAIVTVDLFGANQRHNFTKKNFVPTVKQGDENMVWGCLVAPGPGQLAVIRSTMNSALYLNVPPPSR